MKMNVNKLIYEVLVNKLIINNKSMFCISDVKTIFMHAQSMR